MGSNSARTDSILSKGGSAPLLTSLAVALGAASALRGFQAACLTATAILLTCTLPLMSLTIGIASLPWVETLSQFGKRAIFLSGPQSVYGYYTIALIPIVLTLFLACLVLAAGQVNAIPVSARWLLVFGMWAALGTLVVGEGVGVARGAAVASRIGPIAGFFVGLAMPIGGSRFSRVVTSIWIAALATVPYGLFQFVNGPTTLDAVWAEHVSSISTQGGKVAAYLAGTHADWRAFSYHADPNVWGMFLVVGVVAYMASRGYRGYAGGPVSAEAARLSELVQPAIPVLLAAGMIVSLTRTSWLALGGTVVAYVALTKTSKLRPALTFGILLGAGLAAQLVGSWLYGLFLSESIPGTIDSRILARAMSFGSLEARLGALTTLPTVWMEYPIFGRGLAYSDYFLESLTGRQVGNVGGHNVLLELSVSTGAVGLFLFGGFVYNWLKEQRAAETQSAEYGNARYWVIAFVIGFIFTGYTNGITFMNLWFFLFAGSAAAGIPPRRTGARPPQARVISSR